MAINGDFDRYRAMAIQYLDNGRDNLSKGELAKGGELLWGYVCMELKAVAVLRNQHLGTHYQMVEFARDLSRAADDAYWKDEFSELNRLHVNFYDNILDDLQIRDLANRSFIYADKLQHLAPDLV